MAALLILLEYSEKSNPLKVYKNQLWRGFFFIGNYSVIF